MKKAKATGEFSGIAVVSTVVKPLRDSIFKKVLGLILVCSLIICGCEEIPSPTDIPIAPSNLIATVASSSQIDLAWQDESDKESGFEIERKIGGEGTWSQIAAVGSNTSSYYDTALVTSTTYYYKVRAYNLAGYSEYSNEACCINVPIFKQCNGWGSNPLGTCSIETICSHGCAVTSVAMILKYYGVDTDPGDLNTWLTDYSGYDDVCDIIWAVADDRSGGSVDWAGKYKTDPYDDWGTYSTNLSVQAKWEIDHGYPCVGRVNGHFVVITGYSNSLYSINDPYDNDSTISQSSITAIYTYHSTGEPVEFPDPNLEAAIREAIDKPTGPIYAPDLAMLTHLYADRRDIADLTGLEYATSLTYLRLDVNQISDISPLANLTDLTYLNLLANRISDISPLTNLTSLEYLDVHINQIGDVSALANLVNLRHLGLLDNLISDISPLANLTKLTRLYLLSNQVEDIQALSDLTSLTILWLGYNQISNISPAANLTNLTQLYLDSNQISDVSAAANLTSLTELRLYDNEISDIEALVDNPGLGEGDNVDLRYNPLSDDSINVYIPELEARGVTVYY